MTTVTRQRLNLLTIVLYCIFIIMNFFATPKETLQVLKVLSPERQEVKRWFGSFLPLRKSERLLASQRISLYIFLRWILMAKTVSFSFLSMLHYLKEQVWLIQVSKIGRIPVIVSQVIIVQMDFTIYLPLSFAPLYPFLPPLLS